MARFGEDAIALLHSGDFEALASRFGYALACGREPATAIESDLAACLSEGEGTPGQTTPSMSIKYCDAEATLSTGLMAAVEWVTQLSEDSAVLLALLVTGKGEERHIGLEGIHRV